MVIFRLQNYQIWIPYQIWPKYTGPTFFSSSKLKISILGPYKMWVLLLF